MLLPRYTLWLLVSSLLLSCTAAVQLSQAQESFFVSPNTTVSDKNYQLKWPVRKVAIIGAGPSGMIAYREFTRAGFDVQVFERDDVPGGNWHYTDETPVDAPIPNADIAVGDYTPSLPPHGVALPYEEEYRDQEDGRTYYERRREHRGPKPVWETLTSNAPAPWQQITELPWPAGTPWELTHYKLQKYMRSFASFHGINSNDANPNLSYHTRVELVEKRYSDEGREEGWTLTLKKFVETGETVCRATWFTKDFDAVVVATGRFNAPNIPSIPGLKEWADKFPTRISHSRQYRRPQPYTNETILIVGAATSGGEISRDINPYARKIYQSIRPDNASVPHFQLDNFFHRLPANTTIVPEIKRFHPLTTDSPFNVGRIELVNGTILTGIDRIIFATGFRYSFPFLPQYHNKSIGLNETAEGTAQPLVTDGTHIRSLHLDLFYIEEPTIGFLNMNLGMQSFTYAEYLSLALAKVWGNKAKLPSTREMWRLYQERLEDRGGYGRHFQFLGSARTNSNIRYFIGWLNAAAVKYGGRQIDGIPKGNEEIATLWHGIRFGNKFFGDGGKSGNSSSSVWVKGDISAADGVGRLIGDEERMEEIYNSMFHDYW